MALNCLIHAYNNRPKTWKMKKGSIKSPQKGSLSWLALPRGSHVCWRPRWVSRSLCATNRTGRGEQRWRKSRKILIRQLHSHREQPQSGGKENDTNTEEIEFQNLKCDTGPRTRGSSFWLYQSIIDIVTECWVRSAESAVCVFPVIDSVIIGCMRYNPHTWNFNEPQGKKGHSGPCRGIWNTCLISITRS